MSVESDVQAGAHAAPTAATAPTGNPVILGLATFLPGGITLGLWLIGYLDTASLPGGMIAAVTFSSGLFQLVACVWAGRIGASTVAGLLGTFSGFWLSLGFLLLALNNGLIVNAADGSAITTTQTGNILATYILTWLIVFVLLTLATLRLPLMFTAGLVFVSITFALVLAFLLTGTALFAVLAGIAAFLFCAVFAYILLDAIGQDLGGRAMPMGSPITR